jgi:hypothetical protein
MGPWYERSAKRLRTARDPDGGRPGLLPVAVTSSEVEGVAVALPEPSSGPGHRSAWTYESGPAAAERMNDEREQHRQHGDSEQPNAGLEAIEHSDGLRLPARSGVPFACRSRSGAGGYPPKEPSAKPDEGTSTFGSVRPGTIGEDRHRRGPPSEPSRTLGHRHPPDGRVGPNKSIIRRARPTPSSWLDLHRPNERKMSPRCVSPDPPCPPSSRCWPAWPSLAAPRRERPAGPSPHRRRPRQPLLLRPVQAALPPPPARPPPSARLPRAHPWPPVGEART